MSTGITIRNFAKVTMSNITVYKTDVGISVNDSGNVNMDKIHCESTRVAVATERVKQLEASNVTHKQSVHPPQPKLLAACIRSALYGDV